MHLAMESVTKSGPKWHLSYKVKTQYVQISNNIDTSIKHAISGQSTPKVKGCMDIMFDMVDTAISYWRALMVC